MRIIPETTPEKAGMNFIHFVQHKPDHIFTKRGV